MMPKARNSEWREPTYFTVSVSCSCRYQAKGPHSTRDSTCMHIINSAEELMKREGPGELATPGSER